MKLELKEHFDIIEDGCTYSLPIYRVEDGTGIVETGDAQVIRFVRGSKLKDEEVEKREGTLHDNLIAVLIYDLQFKNNLVPSRETGLVITKLQEALGWIRQRQVDRISREVVGTYQK